MSFSDTIEGSVLDHFFGLATWTAPAAIFAAASTDDPTDDGSGIAEPSDTSYARVEIGIGSDNWTRTDNSVVNDNAVAFPEASESWGTIAYLGFFTAAEGGTFLGAAALAASKAVDTGDTLRFAAGEIEITQD
jgi:hypothetical protein